ncbi:MAG TPA: FTR1 family protein, partial [Nevskiaceae bacterium]|nr:FTR1 family protein [Nevskiaceae bacterium]
QGRGWWVSGGIAAGLVLAGVVAAAAGLIAEAASGMGQEIMNAGILLAAVVMLGWHNVWMAQHGKELSAQMSALGKSVASGQQSLMALATVIALAVLREGSEVVLFLYGIAAAGSGALAMFIGGAVGVALGAAAGFVLYFGLLKIPLKRFFTVTSWMILLLAAGLASQAAHYLIQADLLPAMGNELWDSSRILSGESMLGRILRTLVGYDPRPAGSQLLFYAIALVVIGGAMKLFGERPRAAH